MDLPPDVINPPAIVYREKTETLEEITQVQSNPFVDYQYLSKICQNKIWLLRRLVKFAPCVRDDYSAIPQLKNQQVLYLSNHKSHFDYIQQMYDFWYLNLPIPRIVGRENVFIPGLRKAWEKCGAIKIPFDSMKKVNLRKVRETITETIAAGASILNYPSGGRNYDGKIGDFNKRGIIDFVYTAARKLNKDVIVQPIYITYIPHTIEKNYFPILSKLKGRFGNIPYIITDLFAFGLRFLNPKGIIFRAFGEPFSLLDCKNKHEICRLTQKKIEAVEHLYYNKLANWPD